MHKKNTVIGTKSIVAKVPLEIIDTTSLENIVVSYIPYQLLDKDYATGHEIKWSVVGLEIEHEGQLYQLCRLTEGSIRRLAEHYKSNKAHEHFLIILYDESDIVHMTIHYHDNRYYQKPLGRAVGVCPESWS